MFVLDASIAVKWFFDDERNGDLARLVLARLVEHPDDFLVPDLFYTEVAAVLTRKSGLDARFCVRATNRVYALGIRTIPVGSEVLTSAIELACKSQLSVYDCIYAATAKLMNSHWLTADEKAAKKMGRSRSTLLTDFS